MARWLAWVGNQRLTGWTCSQCGWNFPMPTLLTDQEAKGAYDRLAASKFQAHDCAEHGPPQVLADSESFAARARRLVMQGFKPKDAVEITLQELAFEQGNDLEAMKKARDDAKDFLRRVKEGLMRYSLGFVHQCPRPGRENRRLRAALQSFQSSLCVDRDG